MISHATAYAFLVLNMALWGSTLVVARGTHEIVPPMALAFWRWVFAVVVLLPFVWSKLASTKNYLKSSWAGLLLICGSMVLGSTLSVVAVNFTTALNATLINGSQPAITALVAFVVLRERMPLPRGLGIVVAFVGIVVMISQGELDMLRSMQFNVGDLVMVVAVVAWAVYSVEIHRLVERPDPYVLLFLIAVSGVVGVLPFYVVETVYVREFVPSWAGAAAIVYISFSASLLAVGLWNLAIHSVGATRSALFINLIPVFGAIFAMAFLRERLYLYHVAGALFVFVGILLAVRAKATAFPERPAT
ncbi:MAG TPA: DMT family transporter [Gammaproteobacteria bacterium]